MGKGEDDKLGRSLDALLGEIARAPEVTPADSLVGTRLGRFEVEALLGRGGMGVVYRARDTTLARDVALKVLRPELVGDRERRARFLREARLAASLNSSGTATIFDIGEDDDVVWVAMELVRGETLRALLGSGPLSIARAVAIARDMARGLARAHELGIVHRDLKPENVMLDAEGNAKVLDFGLAKLREVEADQQATSSSTELGRVLGTPSYMSPEQAKGRPVDARSDVFSFGVVFYEMLTAERPFRGETTVEVLIAIDRDPPAPLRRADVPAELRAVVDRCLAKDPAERFADGAAILAALASWKPVKRAGLPFARAGVVAAALAVAIGAGALGARRREAPPERRTASVATVLTRPDAVLACPILEASGVDAPSGWLGATVANTACRRAMWQLGGRDGTVLRPGDLLGLPGAILDDGPQDPFTEEHARERTITAAKSRATAWIDGAVERTDAAFHVTFVLRTPDGAEIGRGEATAPRVDAAVAAAMGPLALPKKPLDPEIARWLGFSDPSLAVAFEDWWSAMVLDTADDGPLRARGGELGALGVFARARTARAVSEEGSVAAPPIDRTSDEAFVRSLLARIAAGAEIPEGLADELKALRARLAPGSFGRMLAATVSVHVLEKRDPERAYDVLTSALAENPHWTIGWGEDGGAVAMRHIRSFSRTMTYWLPESVWGWVNASIPASSFKTVPAMARRSWQLSPESASASSAYAHALLRAGKRDEPRLIAARLARGGGDRERDAEAILVAIDASFARFGAAETRARGNLLALPRFGNPLSPSTLLFVSAVDAAVLAGRGRELADAFAARFVLSDPPRLDPGKMTLGDVCGICAEASLDVAKRCVQRLQSLESAGYFQHFGTAKAHLEALRAHLDGDDRRAAALLRAGFDYGRFERYPYVADVLDAAGDVEMADKVDSISMPFAGYNGAGPWLVRAAKRAAKRHDVARARELAKTVIDAWADADVPVAAVREMRELLAKLDGH